MTKRPDRLRLLADVGGTNARFALSAGPGDIRSVRKLPVSGYPSFEAAMAAYIDLVLPEAPVGEAAVAAAGPVDGQTIDLTNADWRISAAGIEAAGMGRARLFNDLEAVGLSLPVLGSGDTAAVREAVVTRRPERMIALNVGTGLGAAIAVRQGETWTSLSTEAGHMAYAAANAAEAEWLGEAETYEALLSGPGLRRLAGREPDAAVRRMLFSGLLGRFAGDMVLAAGAWDGLCLCGGVLDDWEEHVDPARFLTAFDAKGPMRGRMAAVPVLRIVAEYPALMGLAAA
ncbi:MAG: ROK family protein [Minwuia sp.]|uniref:glucokinase n=1 Tax=Minwuia sp. TaxID=2493630 RepID=UPI003A8561EB